MIPNRLHALFWDVDPNIFEPASYPEWTILRVLRNGDEDAIHWLRTTFPDEQIRRVLHTTDFLMTRRAKLWIELFRPDSPPM